MHNINYHHTFIAQLINRSGFLNSILKVKNIMKNYPISKIGSIDIIDAGVIAIIPYSEVKFRFVSNHYDEHLNGSCIYNNELCEFKTISGEHNEETNTWTDSVCVIYKLSRKDKLRWLFKQWLFEKCVGYHWSYSDKKDVKNFYYRNPQWLYKFLFDWYYEKGKKITKKN